MPREPARPGAGELFSELTTDALRYWELRRIFCNKSQNDVRKLIAGPTVFICDELVSVCNDILLDDARICSQT